MYIVHISRSKLLNHLNMPNLRQENIELFLVGFNSTILIIIPIFFLIYWNMATWLLNVVDEMYNTTPTYKKGIDTMHNILTSIKVIQSYDNNITSEESLHECHIPILQAGILDTSLLQTQEEVDQLV